MAILEGKKAIIIGDRDGIPGPAIAECVKTAGAEGRRSADYLQPRKYSDRACAEYGSRHPRGGNTSCLVSLYAGR